VSDALYVVIGTNPAGEREVGEPRPRAEALRIFDSVVKARTGCFHPHAKTTVKVVEAGGVR
jgi:hypothetical protein